MRRKVFNRDYHQPTNGIFKVTIKNNDPPEDEAITERHFNTVPVRDHRHQPVRLKSPPKPSPPPSPSKVVRTVQVPKRVIKTSMTKRPVVKASSVVLDDELEEPIKKPKIENKDEIKELTKAAKTLQQNPASDFIFTNEDLEELEEFSLPRDAHQVARLARFGRDRDGRNILSVLLEWKNIKAFVKDFTKKSFEPVLQCVVIAMAAGADPMVSDRHGKCPGHYLAEWRFTKERKDEGEPLDLPNRALEIMEELGYEEVQCHKPSAYRSIQPSLLYPRDEEKNNFLHVLIKPGFE